MTHFCKVKDGKVVLRAELRPGRRTGGHVNVSLALHKCSAHAKLLQGKS